MLRNGIIVKVDFFLKLIQSSSKRCNNENTEVYLFYCDVTKDVVILWHKA